MKARLFVRFKVAGRAQPRGSKTIARTKQGKTFIRDDNPRSKPWMETVARVARFAMVGKSMTESPVVLCLTIVRRRRESHIGKRGVLESAAAYPETKPDLTKCVRAIEDALTGIVWKDDSLVVQQRNSKEWGDRDEVEIAVFLLPKSMAQRSAWLAAESQKVLFSEG